MSGFGGRLREVSLIAIWLTEEPIGIFLVRRSLKRGGSSGRFPYSETSRKWPPPVNDHLSLTHQGWSLTPLWLPISNNPSGLQGWHFTPNPWRCHTCFQEDGGKIQRPEAQKTIIWTSHTKRLMEAQSIYPNAKLRGCAATIFARQFSVTADR